MTAHKLFVDGWIAPDGTGHDVRSPDWTRTLCGQTVRDGQMVYTELTCRSCVGDEPLVGQL